MTLRRWKTRQWCVFMTVFVAAVVGQLPHNTLAEDRRQGGIPLVFGEAVSGSLDNEVFRQLYSFEAQADTIVTVTMQRTEGDLDPYLMITDDQGVILAVSDDEGQGTGARIISKRIPEDGRYFVIVTRFGQEHGSTTGAYSLLLERLGVGAAVTTTIQYGDRVVGRITLDEPLAFYFFRAERGDVINIFMRRTSGNLDAQLDLATPDGRILVSNDDDPLAEGTLDAGITNYMVLETGTYLIVATRFGREAGDTNGSFVLDISQTPSDMLGVNPENARLIDYGMALDGAIDDQLSFRFFRFEGRRGDVITASMAGISGNLDPLLKLLDTSLFELSRDDDSGDQRDARIAAYSLPADGVYYLVATRSGELEGQTSGEFTLQLAGRAGVVGGQYLEIVYGATVSGVIDDQNSQEEYVFFGLQGDVIAIAMKRTSDDLDPLVTLYDSERKQIAFDDDGGGDQNALLENYLLQHDGMYIIAASRYERELGATRGAYLLSLELIHSGSPN